MANAIIVISDVQAAEVYNSASESEKEALEELLSYWIIEYAQHRRERAKKNLLALMDRISDEAEARGLTPEILEELLRDE